MKTHFLISTAILSLVSATVFAGDEIRKEKAAQPTAETKAQNEARANTGASVRYIVRMKDDGSDPHAFSTEMVKAHGGRVRHVYSRAFKGFAFEQMPEAAMAVLMKNPHIQQVVPDQLMSADLQQSNPGWGLDRMDSAGALNSQFNFFFEGAGSHIYILDTGVRGTHSEFTGRIGNGVNVANDTPYTSDTFGHGTAVASLAGGSTLGIARKATIHPVKITSIKTAWVSDMIEGVDWVIENKKDPAVMNLSFGANDSFGFAADALKSAADAGIIVTKSAGNDNVDACSDKGNTADGILVVGAFSLNNRLASFSNWGSCVDLFAPGDDVKIAGIASDTRVQLGDGTSFSAPYVAGIAAILRVQSPQQPLSRLKSFMLSTAYRDQLKNVSGTLPLPSGTPNLIANSIHTSAFLSGERVVETDFEGPVGATWYGQTYGGNGTWSYVWERADNGSGSYTKIGSGKSVSISFPTNFGKNYYVNLRLRASSAGQTYETSTQVKVLNVRNGECSNPKLC